jgi:hypothetical protein
MSKEADFIEWNHPFTGYEYSDHLFNGLVKEHENAIHDRRKARLQDMHKMQNGESAYGIQSEEFQESKAGSPT